MGRGKASRPGKTPELPAANGRRTAGPAPNADGRRPANPPVWRDSIVVLLPMLATAATAFIWLDEPPTMRLGLLMTDIVWTVTLVGLLGRLQARRTVRAFEAVLAHDQIVNARLAPDITEGESGLRMKQVSAWLVAVLGVVATALVWQTGTLEQALGDRSTLVVGCTVSVMLALAVAANAINRVKTQRLSRDFRAALGSERLALETLSSLDVMFSACLPTGERTRFNDRFLQFVGKTEAQMQGKGWLEEVHADDRQTVLDLVAKPLGANEQSRQHDMCVRHRNGNFSWIRETLTPRLDDKGRLVEFIGTAVNITPHVENEAALDKQIGALKTDLEKATGELAELRNEHSKARTSRNRFEKSLEESREEIKNLQDSLSKAEANLERATAEAAGKLADMREEAREKVTAAEKASESRAAKLEEGLKSARQEAQQATGENKKLTRAFEKLQEEIGQLKQQEADWRDQLARNIKETREAKNDVVEAQKNEAQHRAKSDRLMQRCEELEAALAAKDQELSGAQQQAAEAGAAAKSQARLTRRCEELEAALVAKETALTAAKHEARQAGAAVATEVQRRLHEVSAEAMAKQLRTQLDAMQRMTGELLAQSLDGPAKDAAQNSAATVRAMSELVNQALGGKAITGAAAPPAPKAAASFDLRRTAQGVRDMLAPAAEQRGVKLEVSFASNLRPVYGDDVEIRTALMSLTDAALHLVEDGTVTMRLSEDVNTGAHSTIRCELSHGSARVKNEAMEAGLALKAGDKSMPDAVKQPVAHQAAKAWRTIRTLQGQHGYQLPEVGGFSLWFTFTLERPAASVAQRVEAAAPKADEPGAAPAPARGAAPAAAPAQEAETPAEPGGTKPRMPQEFLNCNLGEVIELGTDSMRVMANRPPKSDQVSVTFDGVDLEKELRAEVSWSKKVGGRQHDVGLKFIGLTQDEQQRLLRIAMQHRKVATMLNTD